MDKVIEVCACDKCGKLVGTSKMVTGKTYTWLQMCPQCYWNYQSQWALWPVR